MPICNYATLDEPLSIGFTTIPTGINFTRTKPANADGADAKAGLHFG
jgi:hypothetical protein